MPVEVSMHSSTAAEGVLCGWERIWISQVSLGMSRGAGLIKCYNDYCGFSPGLG